MKHLFLSLMLLSSLLGIAQQPFNHDIEGKCSHFNSFKNRLNTPPRDSSYVADTYHTHYMHIKMEVNSDSTNIVGDVSTYAKVTSEQLDTIYLEFNHNLQLDALYLNGQVVDYTLTNAEIFIVLDTPLNMGDDFVVRTMYHGAAKPHAGYHTGLHIAPNGYDNNVVWSFSEPFSARDWLPIRQSLQYKIDSIYQEYTCPANNMVGSNGILEQVTTNGNGTKTFHWKTRYPMAYYLIAFCVSDYMEYNIYAKPTQLQGDSILIQNFIYNDTNCLSHYKNDIDKSVDLMELFCDKFGLYPFYQEKYGNCLTEKGGGMEHQTMSNMGGFSFDLNAHEMAHQWFGDNITCATWSDLWINEGFASYAEIIATEFLVSPAAAQTKVKQFQLSSFNNYVSVYVIPEYIYYGNEVILFSGGVYYKGACLLHQLRYLVDNDDTFFGFLQHYTDTFRGKTATGAQFRDAMEDYTGLDLHPFFEQWYYGKGHPTYSIACEQNANGQAHFTITQTTSNSATPFFNLPLEVKVNYANAQGDSTFRVPITSNTSYFDIQLPYQISSIEIDPNSWIIHQEGEITLGLDKLQNDLDLVVGPNPAHNYLQVSFKTTYTPMTIDIFDISGRLVQSHRLYQSGQHIDISHLPNAYYLVKATQGPATVSKKIVKI